MLTGATCQRFELHSHLEPSGADGPQDLSKKGASAADWTAAVSEVIGGKAGGKGSTSIGSGTTPEKLDEALDVASRYLERFSL